MMWSEGRILLEIRLSLSGKKEYTGVKPDDQYGFSYVKFVNHSPRLSRVHRVQDINIKFPRCLNVQL